MRVEIPDCARCCACVPLRYGIIVFGYLNLAFTTLLFSLEIWLIATNKTEYSVTESLQSYRISMYRGIDLFSQTWFIFILYSLEIVFNAVLLFGAHRKIPRLMRAYYYYGITTCLASFLCYAIMRKEPYYPKEMMMSYATEFVLAFLGLVIQVYLLLLIRSELKKLSEKNQVHFVNQTAEVYVNQLNEENGRNPLQDLTC